jgi:hypothetical protein
MKIVSLTVLLTKGNFSYAQLDEQWRKGYVHYIRRGGRTYVCFL